MSKKRKWAFVEEGATKWQGGRYEGTRMGGVFDVYHVTGGDGVKFERSPYATHGWYVEKNNTNYEGKKVQYNVTNAEDITSLDAFVGVKAYKGWGKHE